MVLLSFSDWSIFKNIDQLCECLDQPSLSSSDWTECDERCPWSYRFKSHRDGGEQERTPGWP